MTREDKKTKKIGRSQIRRKKRNELYFTKIRKAKEIYRYDNVQIPLSAINKYGKATGSWHDPNSPTGYSQMCEYRGICQSPCNGDC